MSEFGFNPERTYDMNGNQVVDPVADQQDQTRAKRFLASLGIIPATGERMIRTSLVEGVQGLHTLAKAPFQEGPILEKLSRARYRDGGYENVQNELSRKQQEFMAANPDATPEQVKKAIEDYQNTQEYVSFERKQIPSVYATVEQMAEDIDRKWGSPTDAEKTNAEQIGKAFLETLVPVNVFSKASKVPAVARFATEMVLPGNQAQTALGKAAVATVAGGITAGMQALTGREVSDAVNTQEVAKLNGEPTADIVLPKLPAKEFPELNTADGEVPRTHVDATDSVYNVGSFTKLFPTTDNLAIFAALGAASSRVKPKVTVEANRFSIPNKPSAMPVPTGEQGKEAVKGWGSAVNEAIDDRAPVQRAIAQAQGSYDKGVQGSNEIGVHSVSGAGMAKSNLRNHGLIGDQRITPTNHMERMRTALIDGDNMPEAPNGKFTEVSEFLLARSELTNRARFVDEVEQKINAKSQEYVDAVQKQDVTTSRTTMQDIQQLHKELEEAKAKRHGLTQYDTDQLKQIVDGGPRGDIAKEYVKAFDELSNAAMKLLLKDGTISSEDVSKILKVHGNNYAPMVEDKLGGSTGIARLFGKAKIMAEEMNDSLRWLELSTNPFSKRILKGETPDFLLNPHDALLRNVDHVISWNEQQLYKRAAVDRMKAGPNFKSLLDPKEPSGGIFTLGNRTKFSDEQVFAMYKDPKSVVNNGVDLSGYTAVKHEGDNGLTTFYKFKDSSLARALEAQPMDTSIHAGAKQIATRAFTGAWNLGFAPMSVALETGGMMTNRPKGVFGYVDRAIETAAVKATGKSAPQGVIDVARIAGLPIDVAIGQAHAAIRTLSLSLQQAELQIADNMLSGLKAQDGWFNAILRTPEGRAWGVKWAQSVVDGYHDTLTAALVDARAVNLSTLNPMHEQMRTMENAVDVALSDYVGVKAAKALRVVGTAASLPIVAYKNVVTNYRDVTKIIFAERGMAMLTAKYGAEAEIPDKEIQKLVNYVRTGTGDFTKRMGNEKMRYLDDIVPYFRVMIQSTKNFTQSMLRDPRVGAGVLGLASYKIGSEYLMANWDDSAYDWYYRQQTPADRAASLAIVRPDIMMRMAAGEKVPFKPEYIWRMFTPQEIRPYIEGIAQGVRGLGAYNAGQNDKETTVGGMFGQAISQAFGISTPPGMAAALASQGVKVELGNMFRSGESVIDTKAAGKVDSAIIDGSSVSRGMYGTIGAMFGTIGRNLAQAYATAEYESRAGKGIADAIFAGAGEFGDRMTTKAKAEVVPFSNSVPWLTNVNERRYRFTSTSSKLYELRSAFVEVARLSEDQKQAIGSDPVFAAITEEMRLNGQTQDYKDFTERYKEIDKGLKAIENDRSIPYAKRQEMQQDGLKKLHELSKEQNAWMVEQEKALATMELQRGLTVADAFKKKTGKDFTFKEFASQIKAIKNKVNK